MLRNYLNSVGSCEPLCFLLSVVVVNRVVVVESVCVMSSARHSGAAGPVDL